MRARQALAALCLCLAGSAGAETPSVRSEVPIREVTLSNGVSFYSIPVTVGGTTIEAGLDTGSTGLRVLPNVLAAGDAVPSRVQDVESFGSGTEYRGNLGRGMVSIGGIADPLTFQMIQTVGCRRDMPGCPASRVPPEQFGVMGLGLPGEGFRALIGIGIRESEIQSPLPTIGVTRWIVELPLPGSGLPGRLILNPRDDEVAGFALLPVVDGDSVNGCIVSDTTGVEACGAARLDTGSTAMAVWDSRLGGESWPQGTLATLTFYGTSGPAAVERFTIGLPAQATGLSFPNTPAGNPTTMNVGRSPYFAFDVLYVPAEGMVGLKPRPPAPDGPVGTLTGVSR